VRLESAHLLTDEFDQTPLLVSLKRRDMVCLRWGAVASVPTTLRLRPTAVEVELVNVLVT
jgi:hypothetical protein